MELSGRSIAITGAAGFIGSHLADRLASDNELILIDDFSIGKRENLTEAERRANVRIETADIRDGDRMQALFAEVDVVFHLAISCLRTSIH